jgi:tetratricopeptide (TPR) repeat protein
MQLESFRYDLDNRVGDAIVTLREISRRWPDDLETLRALQNALYFRWYFAEAVDVGARGYDLYPDDIVLGGPVYFISLARLGRIDESFRATKRYVQRHPREPNGWDELGWRYLALGQPDSAEAAFRKAVELDPDWSPENANNCAYCRGDLKGAIMGFEELLENKNLSPERRKELAVWYGAGMSLAALYMEAGRLRRAYEVCRQYVLPFNNRVGGLLLRIGRADEVLDLATNLAHQDTTRLGYYYSLEFRGLSLVALGDIKGARAAAKEILDSELEFGGRARWRAHQIQAEAALAEHDPHATREALAMVKQQGVGFSQGLFDIDYWTALARACRMDGRLDEAADVHKEMLRVWGGHALSHYELGQICEEMKRPSEAKKEYEKFLEMWAEADEDLPQLRDARTRLAALTAGS